MKRLSTLTSVVATIVLVAGCESTPSEKPAPIGGGSGPQMWWDNPGAIQDHLAVVGVAALLNKRAVGPSRTYAETDGRAKLAATLKTRITQMVENWSKDVGDLTQEASFSSYINNEAFTRGYVDEMVRGTQPYRYHNDGSNIYVLMVLRNPEQWVQNVANDVRDRALQDETLFKTEAMKEQFRQRMDAQAEKQKAKVAETKARFESAVQASDKAEGGSN